MLSESALVENCLRTGRLRLSPLMPRHAPALFPLLNDWEVVRMLAVVPWPLSLADVEAHAEKHTKPNAESMEFAIVRDDVAIGVCGIKRPDSGDPPRRMPRLGYWLGRPYWNRGYATEAIGALVDYAFRSFPHDVVGAGVFRDNAASRRLLERLGFEERGSYDLDCRSRGALVPTSDMQLTRAAWQGARR